MDRGEVWTVVLHGASVGTATAFQETTWSLAEPALSPNSVDVLMATVLAPVAFHSALPPGLRGGTQRAGIPSQTTLLKYGAGEQVRGLQV